MRSLSAIEIACIVKELKSLEGLFLGKIYDLGEGAIRFHFTSASAKRVLFVRIPYVVNFTSIVEETDTPTQFCTVARKLIMNKKLKEISQYGMDRILIMTFSDETKLIIELFAKGNVIITDPAMKINIAYRNTAQKDREVKPKIIYEFPNASTLNVSNASVEQIASNLMERKEDKAIKPIVAMGIAPVYAEQILEELKIPADSPINDDKTAKEIATATRSFVDALFLHPIPTIYSKDFELYEYSLLPLKKYSGLEQLSFQSISEMLERFYLDARIGIKKDTSRVDAIAANIEKQKKILDELETREKEGTESGQKIFENMRLVNNVIEYMQKNKRATLQEVQEVFGDIVKEVDLAKKKVRIEL